MASRPLASLLTCPSVAPGFCTLEGILLASIPSPILGRAQESRFLHPLSRQPEPVMKVGTFVFPDGVSYSLYFPLAQDPLSSQKTRPATSLRAHRGLGEEGGVFFLHRGQRSVSPHPLDISTRPCKGAISGTASLPELREGQTALCLLFLFSKMCLAAAHELCNPPSSLPSAQHVPKDTKGHQTYARLGLALI